MIIAKVNDGLEFSPASSQFFLLRIKHDFADEAIEYLEKSNDFEVRNIDIFWISRLVSRNDMDDYDNGRNDVVLVSANIWTSPVTIDRKLWRFVVSIPGFIDFGRSFLTAFPKLLDAETVDTLCDFIRTTCEFNEKPLGISEDINKNDTVEILFGQFTGCRGKVIHVSGMDVRKEYDVDVELMGRVIELHGLTVGQIKKVKND